MFCLGHLNTQSVSKRRSLLAAGALLSALLAFTTAAQIDPKNPENPYDSLGADHNRGLDAAITGRAEFGSQVLPLLYASFDAVYDLVCSSEDGSNPCQGLTRVPSPAQMASIINAEQRELVIRGRLTSSQLAFYDQIQSAIRLESVEAGIQRIRQIEAEILDSLPASEAQPLLGVASVARHSLSYWDYEASLGAASRFALRDDAYPGLLGPSALRDIAGADAAGFALGYAIGGVSGGVYLGTMCSFYAAMLEIYFLFF
jgi:hypothetical protein